MKICGVTVTYGNRAEFCIQTSEQALAQGVHQLVIVDNGSEREASEKLKKFASRNHSVQLVSLGRNTGSSLGFSEGIKAFLSSSNDIILLLDDDNLLEPEVLQKMLSFWLAMEEQDKEANIALAAFRKDRPNMIAALQSGDKKLVLPPVNSFMGFHVRLVWRFIRQRIRKDLMLQRNMKEFMQIDATAYGGLWMHRSLCERIGLPDSSYVLYMDDFDFTKRITALNGKIILLRDCTIRDIQDSYYLPVKKRWLYHSVLDASHDSITYYTCRNVIYFSKKYLITQSFIYHLNRLMYFIAVFFVALLSNRRRKLGIIFRAVRDGESDNMGLRENFPL